MKGNKKMKLFTSVKKNLRVRGLSQAFFFTAFFILFVLIISLSALLGSCSFDEKPAHESSDIQDYRNAIASLELTVSSLKSEYAYMESSFKDALDALDARLCELQDQIDELKAPSDAQPENEYFGFKYEESNGEIAIISYVGTSTDVIVPASIKGVPVTSIADEAFKESLIRSVSVPDTITSIGWFSFSGCRSLEKAVISKNVSYIGYEAFAGCSALTIYTSQDSYAYSYAKSYGINVSAE